MKIEKVPVKQPKYEKVIVELTEDEWKVFKFFDTYDNHVFATLANWLGTGYHKPLKKFLETIRLEER